MWAIRPWSTLRSILSAVLITVGCAVAPLACFSLWARYEIGDTDTYVATMAPLAHDKAVQHDVAAAVTDAIMTYVDRGGDDAGDDPGGPGPPRRSVESFVYDAVRSFTGTHSFRLAWNAANRATHDTVLGALRAGDDRAVGFDIAPISAHVKHQLVADSVPFAKRIPVEHTEVTVFAAHDLTAFRRGFRMLLVMGLWLPAVSAVLAAGGILLALRRGRAIAASAVGLVLGAGLLLAAIALVRCIALAGLPPDVSQASAGAVYDALTRTLRNTSWTILCTGAAVALVTVLRPRRSSAPPGTGPGTPTPPPAAATPHQDTAGA
jgi:hypothetical protein